MPDQTAEVWRVSQNTAVLFRACIKAAWQPECSRAELTQRARVESLMLKDPMHMIQE